MTRYNYPNDSLKDRRVPVTDSVGNYLNWNVGLNGVTIGSNVDINYKLLYSYDLAINLISLATTNPELYQLDGIRYESVEKAAERDKITSSAWLLHPNLKMIKPQNTIEEKMEIEIEKKIVCCRFI